MSRRSNYSPETSPFINETTRKTAENSNLDANFKSTEESCRSNELKIHNVKLFTAFVQLEKLDVQNIKQIAGNTSTKKRIVEKSKNRIFSMFKNEEGNSNTSSENKMISKKRKSLTNGHIPRKCLKSNEYDSVTNIESDCESEDSDTDFVSRKQSLKVGKKHELSSSSGASDNSDSEIESYQKLPSLECMKNSREHYKPTLSKNMRKRVKVGSGKQRICTCNRDSSYNPTFSFEQFVLEEKSKLANNPEVINFIRTFNNNLNRNGQVHSNFTTARFVKLSKESNNVHYHTDVNLDSENKTKSLDYNNSPKIRITNASCLENSHSPTLKDNSRCLAASDKNDEDAFKCDKTSFGFNFCLGVNENRENGVLNHKKSEKLLTTSSNSASVQSVISATKLLKQNLKASDDRDGRSVDSMIGVPQNIIHSRNKICSKENPGKNKNEVEMCKVELANDTQQARVPSPKLKKLNRSFVRPASRSDLSCNKITNEMSSEIENVKEKMLPCKEVRSVISFSNQESSDTSKCVKSDIHMSDISEPKNNITLSECNLRNELTDENKRSTTTNRHNNKLKVDIKPVKMNCEYKSKLCTDVICKNPSEIEADTLKLKQDFRNPPIFVKKCNAKLLQPQDKKTLNKELELQKKLLSLNDGIVKLAHSTQESNMNNTEFLANNSKILILHPSSTNNCQNNLNSSSDSKDKVKMISNVENTSSLNPANRRQSITDMLPPSFPPPIKRFSRPASTSTCMNQEKKPLMQSEARKFPLSRTISSTLKAKTREDDNEIDDDCISLYAESEMSDVWDWEDNSDKTICTAALPLNTETNESRVTNCENKKVDLQEYNGLSFTNSKDDFYDVDVEDMLQEPYERDIEMVREGFIVESSEMSLEPDILSNKDYNDILSFEENVSSNTKTRKKIDNPQVKNNEPEITIKERKEENSLGKITPQGTSVKNMPLRRSSDDLRGYCFFFLENKSKCSRKKCTFLHEVPDLLNMNTASLMAAFSYAKKTKCLNKFISEGLNSLLKASLVKERWKILFQLVNKIGISVAETIQRISEEILAAPYKQSSLIELFVLLLKEDLLKENVAIFNILSNLNYESIPVDLLGRFLEDFNLKSYDKSFYREFFDKVMKNIPEYKFNNDESLEKLMITFCGKLNDIGLNFEAKFLESKLNVKTEHEEDPPSHAILPNNIMNIMELDLNMQPSNSGDKSGPNTSAQDNSRNLKELGDKTPYFNTKQTDGNTRFLNNKQNISVLVPETQNSQPSKSYLTHTVKEDRRNDTRPHISANVRSEDYFTLKQVGQNKNYLSKAGNILRKTIQNPENLVCTDDAERNIDFNAKSLVTVDNAYKNTPSKCNNVIKNTDLRCRLNQIRERNHSLLRRESLKINSCSSGIQQDHRFNFTDKMSESNNSFVNYEQQFNNTRKIINSATQSSFFYDKPENFQVNTSKSPSCNISPDMQYQREKLGHKSLLIKPSFNHMQQTSSFGMEDSMQKVIEYDKECLYNALCKNDLRMIILILRRWNATSEENTFAFEVYKLFKSYKSLDTFKCITDQEVISSVNGPPVPEGILATIGLNLMQDLMIESRWEEAYDIYCRLRDLDLDIKNVVIFKAEEFSPCRKILVCAEVCMKVDKMEEAVKLLLNNNLISSHKNLWKAASDEQDMEMCLYLCSTLLRTMLSRPCFISLAYKFFLDIYEVEEDLSSGIELQKYSNTLMVKLLDEGMKEEAMHLYKSINMHYRALDPPTYRAILVMLVSQGNVNMACNLFTAALLMDIYSPPKVKMLPYNITIQSYLCEEEIFIILKYFFCKLVADFEVDTKNTIIEKYAVRIELEVTQYAPQSSEELLPHILRRVNSHHAILRRLFQVLQVNFPQLEVHEDPANSSFLLLQPLSVLNYVKFLLSNSL